MRPVIACLLLAAAVGWTAGVARADELPENVKAAFVAGFMKDCIPAAEKSAPSAAPAVVKAYCTCMADKASAITTMDDINYTATNKEMPAALKQHLAELAPGCAAEAKSQN